MTRQASITPDVFYAKYDSSDPFGGYAGGRNRAGPGHLGSDFPWAEGSEVPAWDDGTIVSVGSNGAIGNYVVMALSRGGYGMVYHLATSAPVSVGEPIGYGDLIGIVGNTGYLSIGAHAHVGVSPSTPVAGTGNVIDPHPVIMASIAQHQGKDDEMTYFQADSASADGLIAKGWSYKQQADGPIVAVSNLESIFLGPPKAISGDDLRLLSRVYGLAEWAPAAVGSRWKNGAGYSGPGKLTGKRFYSGTTAEWPPSAPVTASGGTATVDPAPIMAAAKAGAEAGIASLKVPTGAELAKAVNDDAAARLAH